MSDPTPAKSDKSSNGASALGASNANPNSKAALDAQASNKRDELVIRGYSKVIFFWPLAAVSLIFFLISGGWWAEPHLETVHTLGLWWLVVFTFNLLVFGYDFGRSNFITFVVVIAAIALGLTVLDMVASGGVWGGVYDFFAGLEIRLNSWFYLCVATILGFFLGLAWLTSRFDTWTISSNELVRKHGFLGDVKAYSTIHMHVEKEIPDVFEWLLFGSGRLIFKPGNATSKSDEVLIVENVYRINNAEKKVKEYLSRFEVK